MVYVVTQIVVSAQYLGHFAMLVAYLAVRVGVTQLWPQQPALQILRGGMRFASTVLLYPALAYMPMAAASALVFVSPLVATVLPSPLLSEHVG